MTFSGDAMPQVVPFSKGQRVAKGLADASRSYNNYRDAKREDEIYALEMERARRMEAEERADKAYQQAMLDFESKRSEASAAGYRASSEMWGAGSKVFGSKLADASTALGREAKAQEARAKEFERYKALGQHMSAEGKARMFQDIATQEQQKEADRKMRALERSIRFAVRNETVTPEIAEEMLANIEAGEDPGKILGRLESAKIAKRKDGMLQASLDRLDARFQALMAAHPDLNEEAYADVWDAYLDSRENWHDLDSGGARGRDTAWKRIEHEATRKREEERRDDPMAAYEDTLWDEVRSDDVLRLTLTEPGAKRAWVEEQMKERFGGPQHAPGSMSGVGPRALGGPQNGGAARPASKPMPSAKWKSVLPQAVEARMAGDSEAYGILMAGRSMTEAQLKQFGAALSRAANKRASEEVGAAKSGGMASTSAPEEGFGRPAYGAKNYQEEKRQAEAATSDRVRQAASSEPNLERTLEALGRKLGKTTKDVQAAWVKIAQAEDKMTAFAEVQKEWEAEARGGG